MSTENLPRIYIVGAARTPIGAFLGSLSSVPAPKLGAVAIRAALERAHLEPSRVDQVLMGNVLTAGLGQAPARQASKGANVPDSVPTTTVGKVCGSGLEAVVLGARAIALGDASVVVAGGMESMSLAPYYLSRARTGYRMGDGKLVDGMIFDGLWDPYHDFHMGAAGELCARELGITREAQDTFAEQSYRRALDAASDGSFAEEIAPVEISAKRGAPTLVREDEEPKRFDPEKMRKLSPAFEDGGTITAANASKISDGAAAVVLASEQAVSAAGLTPLGRIVGYAAAAQAPEWFTTAPVLAIERALERSRLASNAVDLFEINEAFSVVTLACTEKCKLDRARVNVRGGAVSLGHPIGASGARILVTLLYAMRKRGARRGLATLCIGGGEAVAVIVELV